MESNRASLSLKFAIVGDPMVGKTSLALAFTRNFFSSQTPTDSTTIPEKYCKELILDDVKLLVSVIDTPSLDGYYEKLRTSVYSGINCFLICYAVDNPSSFANVENQWLPEIHEICPNATIILAGTKSDLQVSASNSVHEAVAAKLAKKYHFDGCQQCSAKSLESVEQLFIAGVKAIAKSKDASGFMNIFSKTNC